MSRVDLGVNVGRAEPSRSSSCRPLCVLEPRDQRRPVENCIFLVRTYRISSVGLRRRVRSIEVETCRIKKSRANPLHETTSALARPLSQWFLFCLVCSSEEVCARGLCQSVTTAPTITIVISRPRKQTCWHKTDTVAGCAGTPPTWAHHPAAPGRDQGKWLIDHTAPGPKRDFAADSRQYT